VDDPVNRLIVEREQLDAGLPGSAVLSVILHLVIIGGAFAAPLVFPGGPVLKVADGFAVVLPRGGGGSTAPAAPAAAPSVAPTAAPTSAPEEPVAPPPPKVIKPPKEEPRTGLPDIDSKRRSKPATPPPARGTTTASGRTAASGAATTGTGTASRTPGLEFGPPGVGVPDGSDSGGDFYMASVQQKIWMLWSQQVKTGFVAPVSVTFTILADGSITDVHVSQPSGITMLDLAASRAVHTAAPFGPLPKEYGTTRKTVQATFKPTS
jgi:protein TonB